MNTFLFVFDIDGTLTDTVTPHQIAFAESLHDIGVNEIRQDFNTFIHHTDSYISKSIYEETTGKRFNATVKSKFEKQLTAKVLRQNIREIPGAVNLINALKKKENVSIVYATGALRRTAIYKLDSLNISFEPWQLVASDELYEREKIVEQAILNAKSQKGIDHFDRTISIGDGLWDLKTAKHLKLEFIGVGAKHRKALLKNGAKKVLTDLREFQITNNYFK